MTTIGEKIKEFEAIGKAPNCVTCGNELENSGECGGAWLTTDYWDCDCAENYIHPKTEMACKVCGGVEPEDAMPDSHVAEVAMLIKHPQCKACQKLPSGLIALVEAAGETGAAERDMKAFLLARLSEDDYAVAMRLVHRFRIHCLNVREYILLDDGVHIPVEHRIADPEKLVDLTVDRFLTVADPVGGNVRGPGFSEDIERQRDVALDSPHELFEQDPEDNGR